jgi:hypothetical protein
MGCRFRRYHLPSLFRSLAYCCSFCSSGFAHVGGYAPFETAPCWLTRSAEAFQVTQLRGFSSINLAETGCS